MSLEGVSPTTDYDDGYDHIDERNVRASVPSGRNVRISHTMHNPLFGSDGDPTDGFSVSQSSKTRAAMLDSDGYVRNNTQNTAQGTWLVMGARCTVHKRGAGTVRWVGVLNEQKHVGVELDRPNGVNDGSTPEGQALFRCKPEHGVFVTALDLQPEATVHPLANAPTPIIRTPKSSKGSKSAPTRSKGKKSSSTKDADIVVMDYDIAPPVDNQYGVVLGDSVATKPPPFTSSDDDEHETVDGFEGFGIFI